MKTNDTVCFNILFIKFYANKLFDIFYKIVQIFRLNFSTISYFA